MSQKLLSLDPALKRLRDEGYSVRLRGALLVVQVPYVTEAKTVEIGTLVSALDIAGDRVLRPSTHVVHFIGQHPCDAAGVKLSIVAQAKRFDLAQGLVAQFMFSRKPTAGYEDIFHKISTYVALLAGPSLAIDPTVRPRIYAPGEDEDPDTVFEYLDSATGRAGLGALAQRLAQERVAIIGVGGTGGYILDLVAKTPVQEIRLFDDDEFVNHNAFRAPGAPSIEVLRDAPLKVDYFKAIYANMRKGVTAHPVKLNADNIDLLDGVTFAFVSMDDGPDKRAVFEKLEAIGASFIDVGMGLVLEEGSLGGILRVTASTPERRAVARQKVSFAAAEPDDLYASNIQVADLNCLNAALAVGRWKRLRGFYRDAERELHATYTADANFIATSEPA